MLDRTYTDAFVVVHRGHVVAEKYFDGMVATDTHLLMSVSKSLTGILAGVLVDRGLLDIDAHVTTYLEELRGTDWDGCTVEHLLSMRAGTAFSEDDYDNPESDGRLIEWVSGYTTHDRSDLPANTAEWIKTLRNARPHGGRFEYRSILPDVLAWLMERMTGQSFASLMSEHVWAPVGAANDADIIVDSAGFPVAEGGICATAMDLARFGQMCLARGFSDHGSVVSESWLQRLLAQDTDLVQAFASSARPDFPDAFYRDYWWVLDAAAGVYCARGINGQTLLVHRPSDTVVVKLSTWPDRMDESMSALTDAGAVALCEHLGHRL